MTKLANFMPYRKVVSVMEMLKEIYITKNTVQHALDVAGELLAEKEEYDSLSASDWSEDNQDKVRAKKVYIEADGVKKPAQNLFVHS